ncbi:acyl-CoA dehydrogenase family protein [Mesorhizobium sp. CCNWLW179-1]|uniref:acyl-CoA dehydrogenase family protein n=1 Tax=unclassified Mesorhizobium TaxID=325217 RepID=UPI0030147974
MDYRFSEEQSMLKDSLQGWLGRNYQFDQWRRLIARKPPHSEENWKSFASMGWLGITIPEAHGGLGFGAIDQMIIGEAFGSHLVTEPYLSSIVFGSNLILEAGTEVQKAEWLPRIAEGTARLAFAFAEKQSRFSLNTVATHAQKTSNGYTISGEKILVLDAPSADKLIVLARTGGDTTDKTGLSLFLVDPKNPGVSIRAYSTVDDRQAADIIFDNVVAEALIGSEGDALLAVEAVTDRAIAYLCAEGVGAMQALIEATLAYVKVRKQFGQAIGDFQIIQHRIVDLRVQLECSRALTLYAAVSATADANERARAASAAKVQVGRSARIVGRNAIQLHGGIGMTNELSIGHYFKRLLMVETMLGDIDFHQKRFASLPSELA